MWGVTAFEAMVLPFVLIQDGNLMLVSKKKGLTGCGDSLLINTNPTKLADHYGAPKSRIKGIRPSFL